MLNILKGKPIPRSLNIQTQTTKLTSLVQVISQLKSKNNLKFYSTNAMEVLLPNGLNSVLVLNRRECIFNFRLHLRLDRQVQLFSKNRIRSHSRHPMSNNLFTQLFCLRCLKDHIIEPFQTDLFKDIALFRTTRLQKVLPTT